jgi:GBP family porin
MKPIASVIIGAASALFATAASAQSSVTLYGILDASVEYSNEDQNASVATNGAVSLGDSVLRLQNGIQQGSRLGVRGTEDLGGGLRAIFAIEHRLSVDTGLTGGGSDASGNQRFWNGQAWVGLQGDWGRFTMGRQYVPLYYVLGPTDATGYFWYYNVSQYFNNRLDNSLEYRTPRFGGLNGYLMYSFGENSVAGQPDGDAYAAGLLWASGPISVGAGYTGYGKTTPTGTDQSEWGVGASWKFSGQTQIGGGYLFSDRSGRDTTTYYLSGSLGLGVSTLYLNAVMVDPDGRSTSNQFGAAWSYPLSKRTNVYAATGIAGDVPIGSGTNLRYTDPMRIAFGVRHLF